MTINNRKKREQLEELCKEMRRRVKEIIGEEADASMTIHELPPMLFDRREDEMRSRYDETEDTVEGYLVNTDEPKLWLFSQHWIEKSSKQIDAELE